MVKKEKSLKWYRNRVKTLRSKPQEPQRSPEWYRARNTRVTASEASCLLTLSEEHCKAYVEDFNITNFKYKSDYCMSHYDNREDYIIKKCRTFYGENLFKDSVFTLHGKKFEEIATRLYRKKFNTEVIEFGLLPHSRLSYLAASPDGITPDGVMLEIKCPYSRKIVEGVPPIWYWCQMQIQMEVADLDQCDFLECEITSISKEEFIKQVVLEKQDKGILLNKVNEDNSSETKYIYPPDSLNTVDEYLDWAEQTTLDYKSKNIEVESIFYFISKWFVLNVYRNKQWFNSVKNIFKKDMELIKELQSDIQKFNDYKESINRIRSKEYYSNFESSVCDINDDISTFVSSGSELSEELCLID